MAKNKKVENINKYRRNLNIGIVIFIFILLYIVITVVNYFSKSHLSIYEVQASTLAQDNIVTGLIVRDETVILADYSGYVNYYFPDNARVTKNSYLYSIDEMKDVYDSLRNEKTAEQVSEADAEYMRSLIADYQSKELMAQYSLVDDFVSTMNSAVQEYANGYSIDHVMTLTGDNFPATFHLYSSSASGLISYNTDELCGITLDTIKASDFSLAENYKEYIKRKNIVAAGDPVVKYVSSDEWKIVCELNDSQVKAITPLSSIDFTICEDGFQVNAPFEIQTISGKPYIVITLNEYVQNYLDERFLSIELMWQVSEGYKIPLTAITEKEFFVVPSDYFTYGGNSNNLGLVKENVESSTGAATYDFVECTVYHNDGMYYYIDTEDFAVGDVVFDTNMRTYTISLKETLEGVYNINKGYAVFRRIERITQNDEYCIVSKDTSYGISLYDHIALQASDAVDSGIIY